MHLLASLAIVPVAAAACSSTHTSGEGNQGMSVARANAAADRAADQAALGAIKDQPFEEVCGGAKRLELDVARCMAKRVVNPDGTVKKDAMPSGFGPSDLRSAYKYPASGGKGKTVAVVDAYDDPTAESDLAVYRATFGLASCTLANGCFKKVSQTGSTTALPHSGVSTSSNWAAEETLDISMVSAGCPDCKILLVEANSVNSTDLEAAVNEAAKLGANAISMSWGGSEPSTAATESADFFDHPGILETAASGDQGWINWPQFLPPRSTCSPSVALRSPNRAPPAGGRSRRGPMAAAAVATKSRNLPTKT
jgi:hypothetical protein